MKSLIRQYPQQKLQGGGRPMGRPAEGLRRQSSASSPVGPFLTPPLVSPIFVPFSVYYFENVIFGLLFENVQGRSGRTRFGNRARVVGLARCSPTMRTPSPTTKLLAGMLASEAAAERVFTEH